MVDARSLLCVDGWIHLRISHRLHGQEDSNQQLLYPVTTDFNYDLT